MVRGSVYRTIRRSALDAGIGLAIFLALAAAITFEKSSVAPPQFSDLISMSANAAEFAQAPGNEGVAEKAAGIVKSAVPIPPSPADGVFRNTTGTTAMALMAGIFSLLFAFNVAFFRHLRQHYSTSRVRGRSLH